MAGLSNWARCASAVLMVGSALAAEMEQGTGQAASGAKQQVSWKQAGWGGGGFYYAAAFHPTRDGVIYLAGDVAGVYKSEDHGKTFRMINNGLVNYGVFSLAVDRSNPETVYAATEGGICKSTDGGERWQLLPKSGPMVRQLSGIKGRSIRCVAVDPSNGNIVYVASPFGKVYKSTDGGTTWDAVYTPQAGAPLAEGLEVQFGKSNADYHGGFWMPVEFPAQANAADCIGFGIRFQGGGTPPRDTFLTLRTQSGASYRSRNLSEIFKDTQVRDVVLQAKDFTLDPEYARKNPDKTVPATPDWATVDRLDFVCVGSLPEQAYVGRFSRVYFAMRDPAKPAVARDFTADKAVWTYGNVKVAGSAAKQDEGEPIYSITVSAKDPSMVLAATADSGMLMSSDSGKTWRVLKTPKKATNAAVAETDASLIYGAFDRDGVWKSTDRGETWNKLQGLPADFGAVEVAISPTNPQDVYVIGRSGWSGQFFASHDGGATWKESSRMEPDRAPGGDPTGHEDGGSGDLSAPTNLTINPSNPRELYISANWRCAWSGDAGATWAERQRGADISCVYDIRFSGSRTYVCAMDEGSFYTEDNGASWNQLWPRKWDKAVSGHNWRLAVTNINGVDRVIATCSPWDDVANLIIRSDDGGQTHQIVKAGLPDYYPKANSMWEKGYARALAVDPKNPSIVYLGIDGDPENGKMGGGIFKSTDGGKTFQQMPNQPGSRRMFFGLVVDPTDSNRLFWGSCAKNGGLYRSEDAGQSWELVHKGVEWAFNVHVTADGTVYAPGKELHVSTDHGKTFTPITNFVASRGDIVAIETHPRDPKTIWVGVSTWSGNADGGVFKTTDGGATWQEITGNLPYRKPMVLRFNPTTNELWAGGVGLYRLPQ